MDNDAAIPMRHARVTEPHELNQCANCFNLLEYLRYGVLYCIAIPTDPLNNESYDDLKIVYANRTFTDLTGREHLTGSTLKAIEISLFNPSVAILEVALRVMKSSSAETVELQNIYQTKWFSVNFSRLDINAERALVIAVEDISARKASEEAIRRMNKDFVAILETTSDFIYIKDQDSRIRFCSQTLAEITGHKNWRDMVGKHDNEIFPAETAQLYTQEEQPIFRDGVALLNKVNPYFRADGSKAWISTNKWPMFAEDGKTVTGIFGISRDISESKAREDELRTMATTDFLTGLASRRDFIDDLNRQIARIQRSPQAMCTILLIDLDFFKRVNDQHGHAVGDQMLQHVSRLMRNQLRRVDSIGRIGGEEFSILMPDTDVHAATTFAERLRKKIEVTPLQHTEYTIPITVSIGITQIRPNDSSPENVFERADVALYRAKGLGRNCVELG